MRHFKTTPNVTVKNLAHYDAKGPKGRKQSALGLWFPNATKYAEANAILIEQNQSQRSMLHTGVHEALHHLCPGWTEDKVKKSAATIARVIWELGYRKEY